MPKVVQIRDIPDDTYALLQQRASEEGATVPEFLRRETERIVSRPSLRSWLTQAAQRGWAPADLDAVTALDELRGPWPEPGPRDARR